jgi:hypothetical protein
MPRLVGRVDGYDADGRPRRVMVFETGGKFCLALSRRRHFATLRQLDFESEASSAFGLRDTEYMPF